MGPWPPEVRGVEVTHDTSSTAELTRTRKEAHTYPTSRPDQASQEFPNSANDQGHRGRSFDVGIYPEGGVDPKELDNCPSKLSWKYLKGQFMGLQF